MLTARDLPPRCPRKGAVTIWASLARQKRRWWVRAQLIHSCHQIFYVHITYCCTYLYNILLYTIKYKYTYYCKHYNHIVLNMYIYIPLYVILCTVYIIILF